MPEFREWHDTGWPKGYVWCDESTLDDGRDIYREGGGDGELAVTPDEILSIPDWWTIAPEDAPGHPEGVSVRSLIRRWRKERDAAIVVIEVPKDALERAKAICAEQGWRMVNAPHS